MRALISNKHSRIIVQNSKQSKLLQYSCKVSKHLNSSTKIQACTVSGVKRVRCGVSNWLYFENDSFTSAMVVRLLAVVNSYCCVLLVSVVAYTFILLT